MTQKQRARVSRAATIRTCFPPKKAIRLFSAEGEKLWLGDAGWNPKLLGGDGSTRADVFAQGDMVFVTIAFDADRGIAEYARLLPGISAGIVRVRMRDADGGSVAEIRYDMTSLSEEGDSVIARITEEAFAAEMRDWEAAIAANKAVLEAWLAPRH